ncbi:MAG: SAM-dependent methyltransferase, partial [Anaerovoracaceae bacterium]
DIQILAAKIHKPRIIQKPATKTQQVLSHNREKHYLIPPDIPCDFLIRLGVMDAKGKVYPKHYSKFRQINRFLEILEDVYPSLPEKKMKIIDFGCGKAYLTFALYHYLKVVKDKNVEIIGLDLKTEVIDFCNQVAVDLHYHDLKFQMGDIADYQDDHADMVVTLHACDTATDFALINAVNWNTKVILSVPCCQHELFSQIKNDVNGPMLKHGIIKDKFTELLTDALRGLKLESVGYEVSMIEFTSLEHTSKNIMIKAIKTKGKNEKAAQEYAALKAEYQVSPTIDQL